MATFFCELCQKGAALLPIYTATKAVGVSRSTIYYWMDHGWVHWLELPSGRRVICALSLTRQPCILTPTILRPEVSNSVQPSKLTRDEMKRKFQP